VCLSSVVFQIFLIDLLVSSPLTQDFRPSKVGCRHQCHVYPDQHVQSHGQTMRCRRSLFPLSHFLYCLLLAGDLTWTFKREKNGPVENSFKEVAWKLKTLWKKLFGISFAFIFCFSFLLNKLGLNKFTNWDKATSISFTFVSYPISLISSEATILTVRSHLPDFDL